jgi:hypothetical protein
MSLTVLWPVSAGINYVSGSIETTNFISILNLVPVITTCPTNSAYSQATFCASNLPSGILDLVMKFQRDGVSGTSAGIFGEAVNIWNNITSDEWVDTNGNLQPARVFSLNEFYNANSSLSGLVLSAGSLSFSSSITGYNAGTVTTGVITITPSGSLPGQFIQYNLNGGAWTSIQSGSASGSISLSYGSNALSVKVTAPDQQTVTTYTISVILGYSVSYNASGASGAVPTDGAGYTNGQKVTVPGAGGLLNTGFNFAGWTNSSISGGNTLSSGSSFFMIPNNLILYAVWVPNMVPTTNSDVSRNFSSIDSAISNMPYASSIQDVINYIQSVSHNDWERARGAYDWVAYNIAYDALSFYQGDIPASDGDANQVFANRLGVCGGYSALFSNITAGLGLNPRLLSGLVPYGGFSGNAYVATNVNGNAFGPHAWNAVLIDGYWHFMDSTWGAGYVTASSNFVFSYTSEWFDMDPRLFVLDHFPSDVNWLLMSTNLTLSSWENAVPFDGDLEELLQAGYTVAQIQQINQYCPLPEYFSYDAQTFVQMGGTTGQMITYLTQDSVPTVWYDGSNSVQLETYPVVGSLKKGTSYSFSVLVPGVTAANGVCVGQDATSYYYLPNNGAGLYSGQLTVASGTTNVTLFIGYFNASNDYQLYGEITWPVENVVSGMPKYRSQTPVIRKFIPIVKLKP